MKKTINPKNEYTATVYILQKGAPQKQVIDSQVFSRRWFAAVWLWLAVVTYSEYTVIGVLDIEAEITSKAV
jgi:hypothetical protein